MIQVFLRMVPVFLFFGALLQFPSISRARGGSTNERPYWATWPPELGTGIMLMSLGYALLDCVRRPQVSFRDSRTRGVCVIVMFLGALLNDTYG